jgi:phospholipase C
MIWKNLRWMSAVVLATNLAVAAPSGLMAGTGNPGATNNGNAASLPTKTPIKHVVVIFQENVSFDHYFATYPNAANLPGEPAFYPRTNTFLFPTPSVNGLAGTLLTNNPNSTQPFRLDRSQASTCDQDHNYGAEQLAFDEGLMDEFPSEVGVGESSFCNVSFSYGKGNGLVMGYFDGNTVTALWNYAQNFAMSDNFHGSTFGPSTPGALNVVSGNTYPATLSGATSNAKVVNPTGNVGTIAGDLDPTGDACSGSPTIRMGNLNIGDLLNQKGISWGSFMGGFDLTVVNPDGSTGCKRQSPATPANAGPTADYIPHHAWFQYFASTANPAHTRPSVPPQLYGTSADIGANHEYDTHDFFDALNAGNLPAVSYIKAPAHQDGHAGYSDPLMEQTFLVNTINAIQQSPFWRNTVIFITWDDSDGWYDHEMSPIVNSSAELDPANQSQDGDNLNGAGKCGNGTPLADAAGVPIQGRCGYGPRIPLVVISPFAKVNFVDNALTDFSSIPRFIEDNWGLGRLGGGSFDAIAGSLQNMFNFGFPIPRQVILDPSTGERVSSDPFLDFDDSRMSDFLGFGRN